MTAYLLIGGVGVIILLTALFLNVAETLFGTVEIEAGSGVLSMPVIGWSLTGFGFGGVVAMSASSDNALAGLLGGLVAGVAAGAWTQTRTGRRATRLPPS